MGRKVIYHTIEEKREAQNEASRKYREKRKELKENGELEKPLAFSYSREYHQLRYKLKKEKLLQEQGSE